MENCYCAGGDDPAVDKEDEVLPRTVRKEHFGTFVEALMTAYQVMAPVSKGPQFAFEQIESPEDVGKIRMDYDITILPPKKFLMPQYEELLSFSGRGPEGVEAAVSATPVAMLGIHPYDLHAIATIDMAMCQSPPDPYYQARRSTAFVIGLNIDNYANEHQFMADMGTIDPPEGGFDLFLTDLGDRYYMEMGTELGSKRAKDCRVCAPAVAKDHADKQAYDAAKLANFTKRLPYNTRYLPELLEESYDSLIWDAIAKRCFSCGTCTNVCPTCYCFDVQDKPNLDGKSGVRQRQWDSCQLDGFAVVAGGENFRAQRAGRLRHRIFRKGKFILERTGKLGCVGCGRCSQHCVAKISMLETLQQMADQSVTLDA